MTTRSRCGASAPGRWWPLPLLIFALALAAGAPRSAAAASEQEILVETAALTIEKFLVDPELAELPGTLARARGVLIVPQLIKGGFIVGGEGGYGVLLVRGGDGSWSSPAFYTLAAGSLGLQIGGQVAEAVFTIMSEGAVAALLADRVKLGAELSIAVGPIGKGLEAATTTNVAADVYAFSKAVGLFGGGALEGAVVLEREGWNAAYYGAAASARQIVVERRFFNAHAERLRRALP